MVGLLQIMIYLLCIYLIYKGIEIFQIAFVSEKTRARQVGIVIGIISVFIAFMVAIAAFSMTESMAANIGERMNNLPR